jgi:hypothetical protein
VQGLPSLQAVPFATALFTQAPVEGLHAAEWHWSMGVQLTGLPPWQVPPWQVSVCVQALPSLQAVPLDTALFTQAPVEGLHAAV